MNAFSIALFLHIVGALGLFVAMGLEWTGLRQIRSAMLPQQAYTWMGILKGTMKLVLPSMLTLFITGIYMVLTDVGWVPWILVVLGAIVLSMALSMRLTAPRMVAMGRALAAESAPISGHFHSLASQPILWISIQTRVASGLGIILLKIVQPDLGGSLLVMGAAVILGVASAWPMTRSIDTQRAPNSRPA